ncbi:Chaperone J-domain superfamily [Arabidopsis thaliana x Arabidopsis arenosa]|uniref:Chaperone J-domain superfamily n=1 Tax=Arabidopsis thaliana x Arabidopsis arenosa TaxID=1240361 RepID=A0A8T1XZ96_9BRAS|nr:Chaperone J-domain superfamily [Arabidopsis thaliana x Arabidopsis arenosa]
MTILAGLIRRRFSRLVPVTIPVQLNYGFVPSQSTRLLSGEAESNRNEFPVENAYVILNVSETSSIAEIKASFRRLAKETHPDLIKSKNDPSNSIRFVQILAAYEILSDCEKRAHYDRYLLSRRMVMTKQSRQGYMIHRYKTRLTLSQEMEVVEWLKWYREAIHDIVLEKRVANGTGSLDELEEDFYSAIRAAYFGPDVESVELLPDCFEAEERSVYDTREVLHLVSGRDLFGMVCLVDSFLELSSACSKKLALSSSFMDSDLGQAVEKGNYDMMSDERIGLQISHIQSSRSKNHVSDAYKDIQLHVSGRVVATAIRVPPKGYNKKKQIEGDHDLIHVFLNSDERSNHDTESSPGNESGARLLVGTISGLGTSPDEGSCYVYDGNGVKTHVIMKHRTFLVRHLHWYRIGEKVSICECRCSRAKLPPSKFWLFEPRCGLHDVGGWYVETYGKDKKSRTVLAQRFWDGLEEGSTLDGRLHPGIYLLTLAYRTLDLEDEKRRKRSMLEIIEAQLSKTLDWCKELVRRKGLGT